jgi:DNA-binding response OmpR family regulator
LRLHGFEVAVAHGAHAALALVPTFLPEVALLNIGLPEMDGYELARRIAASAADCLLIAITGYAAQRDRVRASNAGFAGLLIKPVRAAAILAAIVGEDAAMDVVRHRTADLELATGDDDRDGSLVPPGRKTDGRR